MLARLLVAATTLGLRREEHEIKILRKNRCRMSDLFGRAALVAIFSILATIKAFVVFDFAWRHFPADEIHVHLELASQLAGLAFMIFITLLTVVRLKPIESTSGWEPRVSALIGSFLTFLLPLLPQAELPRSLQIISLSLVFFGLSASVVVVFWLGRMFSVIPQARKLVVSGPYAFVRHPLYLTEEIAVVGLLMNYMSLEALVLGAIQWAFQLRRMANEERVLRRAFPEYADYAARTPMIVPSRLQQVFAIRPRKIERPAA
jgi:protein-S-isoprenylcysteine O-methyltransferase Ste14